MKYRVKAGADSAPEAVSVLRGESLLVTKKNRYEEALNYRLIVGGFSGGGGGDRRLRNGHIYEQRGRGDPSRQK